MRITVKLINYAENASNRWRLNIRTRAAFAYGPPSFSVARRRDAVHCIQRCSWSSAVRVAPLTWLFGAYNSYIFRLANHIPPPPTPPPALSVELCIGRESLFVCECVCVWRVTCCPPTRASQQVVGNLGELVVITALKEGNTQTHFNQAMWGR